MKSPYTSGGSSGGSPVQSGGSYKFEAFGMAAQQDRYGVWTLQIPFVVQGFGSIWNAGPAKYQGLDLVGRSVQPHDDGEHFIVTNTYAGAEIPSGGGAQYDDRTTVYDMQATWEEEPIETHPKISELLKKFAGRIVNGEVIFDKEIPAAAQGGGGLGQSKAAPTKNPMYGAVEEARCHMVGHAHHGHASGRPLEQRRQAHDSTGHPAFAAYRHGMDAAASEGVQAR
jgi:hypothetical protein